MSATGKLFRHGGSQAVRLPKEFRFDGTEVRITRIGDRLILEPLATSPVPWTSIDATGDREFMPHGRDQPAYAPERAVFDE
jgi:antitoxin VapB